MFEKKQLAKKAIAPLAGAYVGYIVLNNLNLQINTVGFYQISKIAVAPAGIAMHYFTELFTLFFTRFHVASMLTCKTL